MTGAWMPPAERAAEHAVLSFMREPRAILAEHVDASLREGLARGEVAAAGSSGVWFWRQLAWDSAHFGRPVLRLENAAWDPRLRDPSPALLAALAELRAGWDATFGRYYAFADLPPEDPFPIQALGLGGFRLIETRLTYFVPDAAAIDWPERFPVREATAADVPHLREVAAQARNPFDRYHADPFFGDDMADGYLAAYAEASVEGFATFVLVPDPRDGQPPGAFFSVRVTRPPECPLGTDHACPLGISTGRILLVAVSQARRGWHLRLLSETTRLLAERGVAVAYMTTQATNRPVIRNMERLGYRFGRASHVLAAVGGAEP